MGRGLARLFLEKFARARKRERENQAVVLRDGRNAGALFRRLPFLPYLGLRVSLYAGVVALVSAVMNWLVTPDGLVIIMSRADIVFTVVFCICTILLFGINDLLGPGVLFAFVAGRYYHPRLEERALLFIDMRSSTAIAESLGEVRFLAFLNRFVTDLSLSILEEAEKSTNMSAMRSSPAGSSPRVQTKRAASGPAFPLSTASPRAAPLTNAISAFAPISARACIAVPWSWANLASSRRRSRSSATP